MPNAWRGKRLHGCVAFVSRFISCGPWREILAKHVSGMLVTTEPPFPLSARTPSHCCEDLDQVRLFFCENRPKAQDLADEILEIADVLAVIGWKKSRRMAAVMVADHENVARARRRIKALERQAARMAPRKHGPWR